MRLPTLRAGRAPLAILATAVITIVTLAACAGDQPITAPQAHANAPGGATLDKATPGTDSTYITFDIDRPGEFYPNGWGAISGTYTCSRDLGEWFTVIVTLEQYRRDGALSSTSSYNYSCAQQGRPVELFFAPVTGGIGFDRGKATLTILVSDGAPGVVHNTVTQTVKLVELQVN
jgi:hypothetical protein